MHKPETTNQSYSQLRVHQTRDGKLHEVRHPRLGTGRKVRPRRSRPPSHPTDAPDHNGRSDRSPHAQPAHDRAERAGCQPLADAFRLAGSERSPAAADTNRREHESGDTRGKGLDDFHREPTTEPTRRQGRLATFRAFTQPVYHMSRLPRRLRRNGPRGAESRLVHSGQQVPHGAGLPV